VLSLHPVLSWLSASGSSRPPRVHKAENGDASQAQAEKDSRYPQHFDVESSLSCMPCAIFGGLGRHR